MSHKETGTNPHHGDGEGDADSTSSFQWAGVALQTAFSPGGTKSSTWSFIERVVGDSKVNANGTASVPTSSSTNGSSVLEDVDGASSPLPPLSSSGEANNSELEQTTAKKAPEKQNKESDMTEGHEGDGLVSSPGGSKKKKTRKKKVKTNEKRCKLKWGDVTEVLFSRAVSYDSVPNNGGYPIALGDEEGQESYSIDDYISLQQSKLILRSQELGMDITVPSSSSSEEATDKILHLESRQHDYKKGSNPLFRPLSESERSEILKGGNVLAKEINAGNMSRQRSDSMVDDYTIDLSNLNKELKNIRCTRDQTGCSCKPMKVDKLSNGKMKSELIRNCHLIGLDKGEVESLSKAELSNKMKEMLKECPICISNNCECVKLGIPCFAEVCGCISKRGAVSQICNNPEGQIVFDPDEVLDYRSQFVRVVESDHGDDNSQKRERSGSQ